jgi:hypothetical protein
MVKFAFALVWILAVQDDPIVAEALRGYRHAWSDFREGSAVTYLETTRVPEVDNSGNLVFRDLSAKVTWLLGGADNDRATLRITSDGRESEFPTHFALPHWAQGKGVRRPDEEIAVGDRKFTCRVTVIAVDAEQEASEVTTIWQNAKAPGWAVKVRNETLARGHRNTSEETILLALDQKVKVGDAEVACYLVQITSEVENGNKVVKKEWRADDVPGRVVRRETHHFGKDGREIEAAFSKTEVVSFSTRK